MEVVRFKRNVSIILRTGQEIPVEALRECQLDFLMESEHVEIIDTNEKEVEEEDEDE